MQRLTATLLAIVAAVGLVFGLAACDPTGKSDAGKESDVRNQSYKTQVAAQPAHQMNYSPTRDTINFWIDTWGKPNKLSYVYLQNANGQITGYYVLKGLPVSMCVGQTPPYNWVDIPGDGNNTKTMVPAPGVDGAYYSGAECNTYYGKDATSGAYIQFTAGLGINVLLFDQPLPGSKAGDAIALGPTTVDKVGP